MDSLAVYIHWPYCRKKCPYCDFNSHVSDTIEHAVWREAYLKELSYYKTLLGERYVTSIFFGGGTPSLMEPQTVQTVLDEISGLWAVADDCEITLEANPTSIEAEKFRAFKQAGINRVSVGVQSFRDEQLAFLGREHSASEALKALEIAHHTFDRMSFDLIYARPDQTLNDWQDELEEALQYAKGHLSLYQLTIEDGTQFKTLRDSGRLVELDYDIAGDMYQMTTEMMEQAGLPAYEISNYAAKGQESRHNLAYWRYHDYVGIGPGAHGRLTLPDGTKVATRTHKAPDIWMNQVMEKGGGAKPFDSLSEKDQLEERLMMGLRLREGVELSLFPSLHFSWNEYVQSEKNKSIDETSFSGDKMMNKELHLLFKNNFLKIDHDRLYVPQVKWPLLDSILAKLIYSLQ